MSCTSNANCEHCPVSSGKACIMGIRGRCSVIRDESERLAANPHADAPWTKIALETAGEPVPAPPPPPDPPRIETVSMPKDPGADEGRWSYWKIARSLIHDVTVHVVNGFPKRPIEEYERAMAICRECPLLDANGKCSKRCTCNMSIKASWLLTQCPEGKW